MFRGVSIVVVALCLADAAAIEIPSIRVKPINFTHIVYENNRTDKYLPFITLLQQGTDTSEFWLMTDIMSLVTPLDQSIDYESCERAPHTAAVRFPARRAVRPVCKSRIDFQLCPQCPHFNNKTECTLFRDSCKERPVSPSEYGSYCDRRYGRWRSALVPADPAHCRCCDECVFYREIDQSCVDDENNFDRDEFLPVTSIDFRAGCNPYLGHPDQENKALRCDLNLRRCVPVGVPLLQNAHMHVAHRRPHVAPPSDAECPSTCAGHGCPAGLLREHDCAPGAFIADRDYCNCCGRCSIYYQLDQKCAEYKRTVHRVNGSKEIEVEEELLEPGCDDGLVCRHGVCQDIHAVRVRHPRTKRGTPADDVPYEPCKQELKTFMKKYGRDGHLHYEAPQCTPLWLYAPVQCRRFVCYCALEDGSMIEGIKVPRVDVSNMNCDCAREKCRTNNTVDCDAYGNYLNAEFSVEEYARYSDSQMTDA